MLGSKRVVAVAFGLACAVVLMVGIWAVNESSKTAVSNGAVALVSPAGEPEGTSDAPEAAPSKAARRSAPVVSSGPRAVAVSYRRGSGVGLSDIRIKVRGKERETTAARPVAAPARVAAAPVPEAVEGGGIVAGPGAPLRVPSITPMPAGGLGPFPAMFAALVAGVALESALHSDSRDTPITELPPVTPADSTPPKTPPTTPADTTSPTTPPTTPTDSTATPPTTPTDSTSTPPTTPPTTPADSTTTPPVVPETPEGPEVAVTTTPEPSSLIFLASGLSVFAIVRTRKRRVGRGK